MGTISYDIKEFNLEFVKANSEKLAVELLVCIRDNNPDCSAIDTTKIQFGQICLERVRKRSTYIAFPYTNETYTPEELKVLSEPMGIGAYTGICGGGNQNLLLLSQLGKKNRMESMTVVDRNIMQLLNFGVHVELYNKFNPTSKMKARIVDQQAKRELARFNCSWAEMMNRHAGVRCDFKTESKRLLGPHIRWNMKISGVLSDISEYINAISRQDVHFFYFSNAMYNDAFIEPKDSEALLNSMLRKKEIQDGSVVAFNQLCPSGTYIFMKTRDPEFMTLHASSSYRGEKVSAEEIGKIIHQRNRT